MQQQVYQQILQYRAKHQKAFATLIDPDDIDEKGCLKLIEMANTYKLDFFFVGGSLVVSDHFIKIVSLIKQHSDIPVVLFPGSNLHIVHQADAILFLSLISGRNPEYLIGQQVIAAPILKRSSLEIISTGYMLVNCGNQTTVAYISNTTPIPYDKPEIAMCTAMAGEMLGFKLIYMDGGSGAAQPISSKMIQAVRRAVDLPLVVGGGIKSVEEALNAYNAGADIVVVGNAIETKPQLLKDICLEVKNLVTV